MAKRFEIRDKHRETGEARNKHRKCEEDYWEYSKLKAPGPNLVQGFWLKKLKKFT